MHRLPVVFLVGLLAVPMAVPAHAAKTGDMFSDEGIMASNRPWVPSDRYRHADMFGHPTPYVRSSKDMFDFVRPPGGIGIENLFSAHVPYIPDEPLYHWPKDQPYP